MDNRSDIRDFLATRRARLTPEQVGLPPGGRRRVAGLPREEVAVLAGVSTEWNTGLERGHINGVSDEVLEAVSGALRLDVVGPLQDRGVALEGHRKDWPGGWVAPVREPEEAAGSSWASGSCGRGCRPGKRIAAPSRAAVREPARMPTLAVSVSASLS